MPTLGRNLAIYPADEPQDALYPRFFPTTVPLEWSIEFAKATIPGRAATIHQWVAGGDRPIGLNLMFDNEPRDPIRDWPSTSPPAAVRWFERNIPPFDKGDALGRRQVLRTRPVFRLVLFERLMAVEIVITSVKAEIVQFDPKSGLPARVQAAVQAELFEALVYSYEWKRSASTIRTASDQRDVMGYHVVPGMFEEAALQRLPKAIVPNVTFNPYNIQYPVGQLFGGR